MGEDERRQRLVLWVTQKVLPHEPRIRGWLAHSKVAQEDIDDLMQEAYCRLSALQDVSYIDQPGAFFFQTVRHLHLSRLKRARIVRIEAVAENELSAELDEAPSPERIAGDRREWARVGAMLDRLPSRCRQIMHLRKIEGLSQRDIAQKLGISENVVENEASRGLRLILEALRAEAGEIAAEYDARRAGRRRQS